MTFVERSSSSWHHVSGLVIPVVSGVLLIFMVIEWANIYSASGKSAVHFVPFPCCYVLQLCSRCLSVSLSPSFLSVCILPSKSLLSESWSQSGIMENKCYYVPTDERLVDVWMWWSEKEYMNEFPIFFFPFFRSKDDHSDTSNVTSRDHISSPYNNGFITCCWLQLSDLHAFSRKWSEDDWSLHTGWCW